MGLTDLGVCLTGLAAVDDHMLEIGPGMSKAEARLTIPPSGIILTIKALQTPSLPNDPNSKICRLFGPRSTTGRTSCQRPSAGLIFTSIPEDGSSRKAKTWDEGASLPEKWDVSMSR
jgi:hypothetical protein